MSKDGKNPYSLLYVKLVQHQDWRCSHAVVWPLSGVPSPHCKGTEQPLLVPAVERGHYTMTAGLDRVLGGDDDQLGMQ
jgi:hypothetical protein